MACAETPAATAIADLIKNFWIGDDTTGHIANTSHGHIVSPPAARGILWERAMMILALDTASQAPGSESLSKRIKSDWGYTKASFTSAQLEACGANSGTNWASDDAGWSALMCLTAYRHTHDPEALDRAKGLVRNSFDRWQTDELGGGMWYGDEHRTKSLYQTAIVLASLQISEISGDPFFRNHAMSCYEWIEARLLRSDGLYWAECNSSGPLGANRPNDIHEADSVVFLGGNMAMAVLHARLFRRTGDDKYRLRALRTANGAYDHLVSDTGIYINDRDAWTNAAFVGNWAREVLTLRGVEDKHRRVLAATAQSIFNHSRTANGCYGPSWAGPAEGPESRWFNKPASNPTNPSQIMTSATSVHMIVAAQDQPEARSGN